jgi:hypothetical protein
MTSSSLVSTTANGLCSTRLGNNEHLSRFQVHRAIPEVDPEMTVENNERLIRVRVMMPYGVSFQPSDLELIVVHFSNHSGKTIAR